MGVHDVQYLPPQVVAEILRSDAKDAVQVVDVRDDDFDQNGHIRGAVNLPQTFFTEDEYVDGFIQGLKSQGKKRVIFHCWLSQQRGPWCAQKFASRLDAVGGVEIDYVNVLEQGYKKFSRLYINDTDLVDLSGTNVGT